MTNSRASKTGLLEVIEDYKATGAEASHIFTITEDMDDISELILVIDGETTATLSMQMIINSDETSIYHYDGRQQTGGTETLIDIGSEEYFEFLSIALLNASKQFTARISLKLATGGTNYPTYSSEAVVPTLCGTEILGGGMLGAQTSFTEIEIQTSTSTWKTGTRMTLYRVKRS